MRTFLRAFWIVSMGFGTSFSVNAGENSPFAEPPDLAVRIEAAKDGTRPERVGDPYLPGAGFRPGPQPSPPVYPLVRPRGGGFESIQVNVNLAGRNIEGDAANEPSIAIDPTNPNRIVIGWRQFDNVGSDFRQAGRAYSEDGGITWTFPGVLQPGEFGSDPVVDSDSKGNFYYYSLQPNRGPLAWSCYMYKSTDGGATFPGGGVAAYGGDKAWFTIDKTGGVGNDNIYVAWSSNESANCCGPDIFTRSVDGGQTFLPPVPMPLSPFAGTLAVARDGTLYIVGAADSSGRVTFMRSISARIPGATPTFNLSRTPFIGGTTVTGGVNPEGLLGQVWVATDNSDGPTAGAVYVCASVRPLGGGDPQDVLFIASGNAGSDWSTPVRLNDDPLNNGAYQWFGTMSVAPNGRIDVIWNDTREDPTNNMSRLYYTFSLDGGRVWSRNQPITQAWNHYVGYPQQYKIGDYYHMISDEDSAHLAYAATYNGEQDVYYLRVIRLLDRCKSPEPLATRGYDCNGNGVADDCDIFRGDSLDRDNNQIPDECESDFDCDTRHDGSDPDIDNDGVANDPDICDFTPLHASVTLDGRSFGDLNGDCTTDLLDYDFLSTCVPEGGPDLRNPIRYCRLNFDRDGDEDVDLMDVGEFQSAFTGTDSPPPNCDD